nr:hypothetical protein CFP56_39032 [Quercus suber]
MFFGELLVLAGLLSVAAADYNCRTDGPGGRSFTIRAAGAKLAMVAGGDSTGASGFPHAYGGITQGTTRAVFYGADPRCNQVQPDPSLLLEYPVNSDGSIYDKDAKRGGAGTTTPARVIYLQDGSALCGVITHVIEAADHTGSGGFRVCDSD